MFIFDTPEGRRTRAHKQRMNGTDIAHSFSTAKVLPGSPSSPHPLQSQQPSKLILEEIDHDLEQT
jgi:hypothetical protein